MAANIPAVLKPLASAFPAAESLWDDENQVLALRFPHFYPGTDEEVMVYATPDEETGGWKVDDGGSAAALLDACGADPSAPGITEYLKTVYEESVLMMNEAGEFGIPVIEPEDFPKAAAEVASRSVALYVLGRFGAAGRE